MGKQAKEFTLAAGPALGNRTELKPKTRTIPTDGLAAVIQRIEDLEERIDQAEERIGVLETERS